MQLILLAAGRGSRLPKNYRILPKCMALINKKTILDHNLDFYKKFKNKILITGYKGKKIHKFAKQNNFKIVHNNKYKNTNMVYSLFLSSKFVTQDVIICYGDIIFDSNLYKSLKKKTNLIPLNKNWLKLWKKRMSKKNILNDAENLEVKNGYLKSIGAKIKKFPTYQYMGIVKLMKKDFFKARNFFNNFNDKKIDMTSFLNNILIRDLINFKIIKYNSYWYEIDNAKDIKVTQTLINKW
tara:strand:+ start:78 stop:794 length:717 start_codon:yes stop_codon:yes gene_type:complete